MSESAALTVLGVIPARLSSQRLPRKVLREVAGRALVLRVYDAAKRSAHLSDLLIATDSRDVVAVCAANGVPAVGANQHAGWGFQVLPYLEGTNAWRAGPAAAIGTPQPLFFCPSRREPRSVPSGLRFNEVFNRNVEQRVSLAIRIVEMPPLPRILAKPHRLHRAAERSPVVPGDR